MNVFEAQSQLASVLLSLGSNVEPYFWRLRGDEPNGLNRFLGLAAEEMKSILRLCGVFIGKDGKSLSKNNFEMLIVRGNFEFIEHSLKNKFVREKFLRIGNGEKHSIPKDNYDDSDQLSNVPLVDVHWKKNKAKKRALLQPLLDAAKENDNQQPTPKKKPKSPVKPDVSPKGMLLKFFEETIADAVRTGNPEMSNRSQSRFSKLFAACVDGEAKLLVEEALEQMRDACEAEAKPEDAATPDRAVSNPIEQVGQLVAPTVLLPADDDVDLERTPRDEVIAQLQEEALLQTMLRKHVLSKRALELQHNNGRRFLAVSPPETNSTSAFMEEAKRTGWIDSALNSDDKSEGMLLHLGKTNPDLFSKVAKKRKLEGGTIGLSTVQTLGLARVGNLNDARLEKVRSCLKKMANVVLQCTRSEAKKADRTVGTDRTKEATFGKYVHEWADTKGKEKKEPEEIEHWNASLLEEVAAEVDLHLHHPREVDDDVKKRHDPPEVCHVSPGFDKKGVVICIGGDHGDKNCPINAKINLTSPCARKEKGDPNYQCPTIQFASVKCSKDAFEVMEKTVMPTVKEQVNRLKETSILTLHETANPTKNFKSCPVYSTIDRKTIACRKADDGSVRPSHACYNEESQSLCESFEVDPLLAAVGTQKLGNKTVVSRFHELFIGDLAFLAMLVGMNNSAGKHCLSCQAGASGFNTTHDKLVPRTRENLRECLEEYLLKVSRSTAKKPPADHLGVNKEGLLDIDPWRIITPILHCPMGLVDEALESFKTHANSVERLSPQAQEAKDMLQKKKNLHAKATANHKQAKSLVEADPNNEEAKKLEKEFLKAKENAAAAKKNAKEAFDEALKTHNARKASLVQKFEAMCRSCGTTREHYHGGKFNGVDCVRIMDKSKELFLGEEGNGGFYEAICRQKRDGVDDKQIHSKCQEFARMLGPLDAIWSSIRSEDVGLLPTEEQIEKTSKAIDEGKIHWLKMGPTTNQPKWHLTFDGHPLHQCKLFGGIADKADDTIEAFHQVLKRLRERCRGTRSYKTRENCIRRELRRQRCPTINAVVSKHEKSIKQSAGTKRKQQSDQRTEEAKRIKSEKREKVVDSNRISSK